ncbi:LD-carboxypeptidase [Xenorhabdus sp. Sc-CR9]|uniref:LD-carboxypeptidase n=1 Tax=Xenorhabdus sp. Sc-CR9 TaxID=2584468 RepID=UPI001F4147FF|nr:LD-carboxypeptidase [Xenorhabdus sp. Sc-CR9]
MKVYVWAPSNNGTDLNSNVFCFGVERLKSMGFDVVQDGYLNESIDELGIVSPHHLIDFYDKFLSDKNNILLPVYGGLTCNLLLQEIIERACLSDQQLLCGKSDLTCLLNGMYTYHGIKSLYGIDFSKLCNPHLTKMEVDTIKCAFHRERITFYCPKMYNDGYWYLGDREDVEHEKWSSFDDSDILKISGVSVGGNLESLCNLIGTKYLPSFNDKIVVLEATSDVEPKRFMMNLKHLEMSTNISSAKALIFGKFAPSSRLNHDKTFRKIFDMVFCNLDVPIIYNIDISHTEPSYPFYIGGNILIDLLSQKITISYE